MTVHAPPAVDQALSRARHRPWASVIELVCRAGYAARGFVYVSIGLMALLAALEIAPKARGATGALQAWSEWPLGVTLLWLTGLGLYGFAGWRALQSIFDADRQGRSAKALASRLGQAISGVVYGGLAVSVFGLLDALEDLGEVDDQAKTRAAIGDALAMPGGELLVIGAGVFVVGVGVGSIVQAFRRDFSKGLGCSRDFARRAALLGRVGYGARGVAFLPAGVFMILAGLHARSGEAKGTGAALDWLEGLPFGGLLMGLTALGLIAFGLFAFVEARFRTLRVEEVIET